MLLFATSLFIIGAFAGHSCTQNSNCGAGEKCYDGECVVSDGPGNMCGGPTDSDPCFECFECTKQENACMPIRGCVPSVCKEDKDCERGQICYNNDCALPDKIPGSCIGRGSCVGLEFYDCESDHHCSWDDSYGNDAGMGAKRKGGKGNRGGGSLMAKHALSYLHPFNIASLESDQKGLSLDADGNIEYDEDGYALLTEYDEMCGGANADQECYECFECNRHGTRCIPISGCVPHCEVDDDCTREQICVAGEQVCRLDGGRPAGGYRDSEDNGAGQGAARKGGKGNRGSSDSDENDSSWGGPSVSAFTIGSLEEEEKGLSLDADGNIKYDEDGYAVLKAYDEMCGGRNADQECYECFECSSGGGRCVPIEGCIPSCEVDDDCTREQVCEEDSNVCRLPGGRPCGGYRDSEDCDDAGMGSKRKGGKGNRGNVDNDRDEDDSSWGGPSLSAHASMSLASLEEDQKGFSLDADGNIEYDEDGYAVLEEYAEMCGGKNGDQECYACFECGRNGDRCIPVSDCVPSCEVDDDCTREQICVEGEDVCRLEGGRPAGGYRDSEDNGAGQGAARKGGKGNRGSSSDDDSSWGGPSLSAHASMSLASLESDDKGFSLDADGNIEYDEDGYAILDEYAEMCGGANADQECYECFECSRGGNRCIPVSGCVPHCDVDDDCTREQICVEGEQVCRLEGGRPAGGYRDSEDNGAGQGAARKGGKGNRGSSSDDDSSWGGPVLSAHATISGCCRGPSLKWENAEDVCAPVMDQIGCERKECEWVETTDPTDCEGPTSAPKSALSAFTIASLESDEKGLSYDADGNIEYDDEGYALLTEYGEMCGGANADQECYECFECSRGGNRCIPISGCVPSCEVDDDCTREQICVEGEDVCRLDGGRPAGGYRDSEDNGAGQGAARKGGKGNRGSSSDEDDSWGGPSLSAHETMSLASLESEQKGFSLDADGNIEYDEDGYAVLEEYAEMCGGKNADQECYACFECGRNGDRCIPVSDCVPSCEVDDDCTREQICVEGEDVCRLEGGRPGGYRDSEDNGAGMGAERKGGKGNRGSSSDDSSSWGGPSLSAHASMSLASLEEEQKGFSLDADGNIEYDEDGYAVLEEYAEMCGGKNGDQECYACFECGRNGDRCIPVSGCVPSCEVDDDCTREQICVEDEFVCRLEGGRPGGYRDSEDNGAGMGAERKGGKGNRGSSSDEDDSSWGGPSRYEAAVNGVHPMETSEEQSEGLSYLVLLWCSIAAVLLFAAAWMVEYIWRADSGNKYEEIPSKSSHLVIGDQA